MEDLLKRLGVIGLTLALLGMSAEAYAIYLRPVLQGLAAPVLLTSAGDGSGRLFVVELAGTVKVVAAGSATPVLYLDIADRVLDGGERGLLGLAFHPDFGGGETRFYVHYTREGDGANVIARYQAGATPAITKASEDVLLVVAHPFANHNGGMIAFGPDGYLYIGLGDGGSANDPGSRSQNIDELLGKILRIDVSAPGYAAPADNPFVGTAGRDEIYAVGLRNPYRFSFDRSTGDLLVGDVGQGQREEIDIVTLGANLGWRRYEGTRCTGLDPTCATTGLTFPIAEYDHSGGRCSVTGGYAYRGTRGTLPYGAYVFADYCTGEIFVRWNGVVSVLVDTTLNISSFGEDENGELYVVGLGGSVHALDAARFRSAAARQPDLDGNGAADVIWRHEPSGAFAIWLVQNAALLSGSVFGVPLEWKAVATGDLDGNGRSDIVWRSSLSGLVAIWLMNGHSRTGSAAISVGPGWDLVAAADVNGDGRDDLLWRDVVNGGLLCWLMDGTRIARTVAFGVGSEWHLAGAGDLTGDGTSELVWRHQMDSRVVVWTMVGGQRIGTSMLGIAPAWDLVGVQDADADLRADLLWRHTTTGSLGIWLMQGATIRSTATIGASAAWVVSSAGDVNGDGAADVLWRRPGAGVLAWWFLDGTTVAGTSVFGVDPAWSPVEIP